MIWRNYVSITLCIRAYLVFSSSARPTCRRMCVACMARSTLLSTECSLTSTIINISFSILVTSCMTWMERMRRQWTTWRTGSWQPSPAWTPKDRSVLFGRGRAARSAVSHVAFSTFAFGRHDGAVNRVRRHLHALMHITVYLKHVLTIT